MVNKRSSPFVGATALTRTSGSIWYESAANSGITVLAVPEPSSAALLLAGAALGAFAPSRCAAGAR